MIKKVALLALYFSVTFSLSFSLVTAFFAARTYVEVVSAIPAQTVFDFSDFIRTSTMIVPFALYFSILMSVSYSFRENINPPAAFIVLLGFSSMFAFFSVRALTEAQNISSKPLQIKNSLFDDAGLISYNNDGAAVFITPPSNKELVFVDVPKDMPLTIVNKGSNKITNSGTTDSSAVSAVSNMTSTQNNFYLRGGTIAGNFIWSVPLLVDSFKSDLDKIGKVLTSKFSEGTAVFFIFVLPLLLFLQTILFVFRLKSWQVSALIVSVVFCRLVIFAQAFLLGTDFNNIIAAVPVKALHSDFFLPLSFMCLSAFFLLQNFLLLIVKSRPKAENNA